jgi:hypothetical protein
MILNFNDTQVKWVSNFYLCLPISFFKANGELGNSFHIFSSINMDIVTLFVVASMFWATH